MAAELPKPCVDLIECLDFLFGVRGSQMAGLSVWEILDRIRSHVYPCPSMAQVRVCLQKSPPFIITDEHGNDIGALRDFDICEKGFVIFDLEKLDNYHDVVRHEDIDAFVAAAVRYSIQDFILMNMPDKPIVNHAKLVHQC